MTIQKFDWVSKDAKLNATGGSVPLFVNLGKAKRLILPVKKGVYYSQWKCKHICSFGIMNMFILVSNQVHHPCVHTKFSILISSVFCELFTLSFKFPFHPKAQPYSRHPSMNLNTLIILHNKHIDDPP